jgi:carbamoyltransferase
MTYILGLSAYYHDSAATLIKNGEILSAVQEERFTRIKHDSIFPAKSIEYILNANNITIADIDCVVFYDKPFLKFERIIETNLFTTPRGFNSFRHSVPKWIKEKIFLKKNLDLEFKKIDKFFDKKKIKFSEHHISHAASAFYPSPFKESVILTIDGVGEWATTTIAHGVNNQIKIDKEIHFPNSLGLLYSAFTSYCGFKVNSGEYKLMGLAPYGNPKYIDKILNNIIDIKEDGSFRMNQKYFNYMFSDHMVNSKFEELFEKPVRKYDEKLEQFHMDIASSIQNLIELILIKIGKYINTTYGKTNLCLAGGVALNCVANGRLSKEDLFKDIWVQPASGDAGGSLGAALAYWFNELNSEREINPDKDTMKGSYLGPKFNKNEIEISLKEMGVVYEELEYKETLDKASEFISQSKVIGWFQGQSEFGPRALGNRSILADATEENMQSKLNLKIKFRESFRPFAPSVLFEDLSEWFELNTQSPYMLMVSKIKADKRLNSNLLKDCEGLDKIKILRSKIQSVTHVDYSSRIQTVHEDTNKKFYDLIKLYKEKTGIPLIINTSFNIRGEPIVNTPKEAINCFLGTGMDVLIIENYILKKELQPKNILLDYKAEFELD